MRLVVQRVSNAKVVVEGKTVGEISCGALVLFGVSKEDTGDEVAYLAGKLASLRMFTDEEGKMNLSLKDIQGEVLIVSQFTLYADCSKGRRPSFIQAAPPKVAEKIYERFVDEVKRLLPTVQTGIFGAKMEVSLLNDGPVTFVIENSA